MHYKDKKLEKLCTNQREMQRQRPDLMKKLRVRINALEQAESIGQLPIIDPHGRWHELKADLRGLWAGSLSGNWRLLIEPEPPGTHNAVIVTVVEITDYH